MLWLLSRYLRRFPNLNIYIVLMICLKVLSIISARPCVLGLFGSDLKCKMPLPYNRPETNWRRLLLKFVSAVRVNIYNPFGCCALTQIDNFRPFTVRVNHYKTDTGSHEELDTPMDVNLQQKTFLLFLTTTWTVQ